MKNNRKIRSQYCSCYDCSAVMVCAKLWVDQIINFYIKATCVLTRFGLEVHKPFVKWLLGTLFYELQIWKKMCSPDVKKHWSDQTTIFAVVTYAKLWPDWIIKIEVRANRLQFWVHELVVTCNGFHPACTHSSSWNSPIWRCCLTSIGISIIEIRWSHDRLIFIMQVSIPGKMVFVLKWGPSVTSTHIFIEVLNTDIHGMMSKLSCHCCDLDRFCKLLLSQCSLNPQALW